MHVCLIPLKLSCLLRSKNGSAAIFDVVAQALDLPMPGEGDGSRLSTLKNSSGLFGASCRVTNSALPGMTDSWAETASSSLSRVVMGIVALGDRF